MLLAAGIPNRICLNAGTVSARAQPRWSWQMTWTQLTNRAPACATRCRAVRCASRDVPRLLGELALSRGDGRYMRRLAQLAKIGVLVLEDFLITTPQLDRGERTYSRSSTIAARSVRQ